MKSSQVAAVIFGVVKVDNILRMRKSKYIDNRLYGQMTVGDIPDILAPEVMISRNAVWVDRAQICFG
jgi:hypothetical protein